MKALKIESLYKNYGALGVLQGISFDVDEGEKRAIIGPNGAGKTTLFNIISGDIKCNSGSIYFYNDEISCFSTYKRAKLGIGRTYQQNNLFFKLTLLDNVLLALRAGTSPLAMLKLHRFTERDHHLADTLLKNWDLFSKKNILVGELSYGEQRVVEMLLAIASGPKLLLLDEPFAGISPAEGEVIISMLKALPKSVTLLIIEHDMDLVFRLSDRITVLYYGQVLTEGNPSQVRTDPRVKEIYLGAKGVDDFAAIN